MPRSERRLSHHAGGVHEGVHRAGRRAAGLGRRGDGEPGYILVTFALLLVPLLLMVGLAVDVGSWYNRASDLQKASDAAALAGVVWLPDTASARTAALAAAERNGFKHGVDGVTVQVEAVPSHNRRLRVTIKDPQVSSFLYRNIGGSTIALTRKGTAEYVLPVPLGSPQNTFGGNAYSDPSVPAANQANLWGNIHGPRTDNVKGDAYSPLCRNADNCTGQSNTAHRSTGYLYAIDVPDNVSGLDMQIFDAGLYDRGSNEAVETGDRKYTNVGTTTTTWTFYDRDGSELDVNDNPKAASTGLCSTGTGTWELAEGAGAATYRGLWSSICRRTGSITPGRYLLRVQTSGDGSSANRYALRVLSNSSQKARISAYGDMSMYNNVAAGNAAFYLAEVDPVHKGKTLELSLYDPGEVTKVTGTTGNGTIQVLTPAGTVAASCGATTTSGTIASTLTPCEFQSAVGGTARFNGAWVTLQIPIPTTYNCTLGTLPGCWWRIKYVIDGQGNDTTTWAAQVIGDPVHLVEE
ncbi:MAG TPA: pilus assembly protein TadG-related protein [Aquihabitans sp.]|nr:pilus assembly protein TadG-related protein [Aquihabitans sp.]